MRTEAAALLAPLPGLRLAPVRHHSPRCAYHLRALMRAFRPSHVLIEGPAELDALLPALQHGRARPPLAAYLHARVAPGGEGEGGEDWHCRCYVPFAAFSPEWVALREAARQGAVARFIDLPYGARLREQALRDYFAHMPEPTLAEEPARQAPDAVAALVRQGGCRDFDEWWDRHFEAGQEEASADGYFAAVLGLSDLLRAQTAAIDPEDVAREAHMAAQVRAALDAGGRCLVVCGGMHVAGIVAGLRQPAGADRAALAASAEPAGVHLIPYTLARLERASGYAAGMPAPGYYQDVWQALEAGTHRPDEAAWPAMAARLVQALRERQLPASLPDATEAVRLAHGLAALRGCHGGRMELLEALHSAVLREGEEAGVAQLAGLLGDGTHGQLPPNAPLAPLLSDVQDFCARHGLPARPALPVRKELDIYRSARHRRISQGLHRLGFLGVPYAQRLAGPDFVAGTDLARVREVWSLGWQLETPVALTEAMRYGSSLQEAAIGRVREKLAATADSGPAGRLLEVLVMGLEDLAGPVLDVVAAWVRRSHDALALAQATARLAQAFEACHALGGEALPQLPPLLASCFGQACLRLPWLGQGDAGQQAEALDALADLHGMVCRGAPWSDAAALHDACVALHGAQAPARVRGAAAGILSVAGRWEVAQAGAALDQALGLAEHDAVAMGEYLQGFLRISRGWLLSHPPMLGRLATGVARWPEEAFLHGLPALRLAFAQLSRAEIRQWGERLVALPGAPGAARPGQERPGAAPQAAGLDHGLAAQVQALLQPWGLA